jgi:hypothetical protein
MENVVEIEIRNCLLVDRDYYQMIRIFDVLMNENVELKDRQDQEMKLK